MILEQPEFKMYVRKSGETEWTKVRSEKTFKWIMSKPDWEVKTEKTNKN